MGKLLDSLTAAIYGLFLASTIVFIGMWLVLTMLRFAGIDLGFTVKCE